LCDKLSSPDNHKNNSIILFISKFFFIFLMTSHFPYAILKEKAIFKIKRSYL